LVLVLELDLETKYMTRESEKEMGVILKMIKSSAYYKRWQKGDEGGGDWA
jgi:hypothetical protein